MWWAAVGENIGTEIDGKNNRYSRPVVILRKHNSLIFTVTPLTSKIHQGTWYESFIFQNKAQTAVLVQTRAMSVARLYTRIGRLSKGDLGMIKGAYIRLIEKNMP